MGESAVDVGTICALGGVDEDAACGNVDIAVRLYAAAVLGIATACGDKGVAFDAADSGGGQSGCGGVLAEALRGCARAYAEDAVFEAAGQSAAFAFVVFLVGIAVLCGGDVGVSAGAQAGEVV